MLLKKGVIVDGAGLLQLDPSYKGTDQPTQAQLAYLNDPNRSIYPKVELGWANTFDNTVTRMLAGDSTDPEALHVVFYLRLWGWLVEFQENYSDVIEWVRTDQQSPNHPLRPVLAALDAIRGTLTEDELLYAEYRRHVEGHMRQEPYDLQLNKKGELRTERGSLMTGKSYDKKDLDQRIAGVIRRYGRTASAVETAIALDFARRLASHVRALSVAMNNLHGNG